MNKYKLVPIEPTREMIDAGQMAVSGFPRDVLDRYQAMLAAAPEIKNPKLAVHDCTEEEILMCQHVLFELANADSVDLETGVVELYGEDDQGREAWAEVNFQEYAAKAAAILGSVDAAPDVAILVETLESIAEYWNQDSNEGAMRDACEYAQAAAQAALAAYHKQGGESCTTKD